MLTVLGGLAEFERDLIRARTGEGRKKALANGLCDEHRVHKLPAADIDALVAYLASLK